MKILTTETKLGRRVQSGGCAIHCQNCSISQLCIPFTLNEHELNQLDNIIERKKPIQKSQVLFKAGDELTSIYAIRSGTIKSYTISETGEEQITSFHLPGDLVGFDAIMNMQHPSFAQALETAMVCEIPFDILDYNLSQRYSARGFSAREFRLTMTRGDIGNYLGLTVETISRLLGRFQKLGILSVQGKYITINNMAELIELSGTNKTKIKMVI